MKSSFFVVASSILSLFENYDCCCKTGLLYILRQNPNLTLSRLYHSLSLQDDSSSNHHKLNGQFLSLFLKPLEFFSSQQSSPTTLDESSSHSILYIIIAAFFLLSL